MASLLLAFPKQWLQAKSVWGKGWGKGKSKLRPNCATKPLETIEWLDGSGDALLVDNRDGNAANDMNGTRLFSDQGGTYDHGYQQLAELDSNGDAKVDEGELFTLQELGISEIELQLEQNATDDEGRDLFRSSATLEDGSKILTEDVWFAQTTSEDEEQIGRPDLSNVMQQDDLTG